MSENNDIFHVFHSSAVLRNIDVRISKSMENSRIPVAEDHCACIVDLKFDVHG